MRRSLVTSAHGWEPGFVQIRPVKTSGDRIQDRPLSEVGGKGLWTKELDQYLLGGETDLSVHSMKDVESERPSALTIAAMLPRADVRDRLIGAPALDALSQGATVGTSSPRRTAQLLRLRPDLQVASIRGNVATRLGKIAAGQPLQPPLPDADQFGHALSQDRHSPGTAPSRASTRCRASPCAPATTSVQA